jgi:NADP-dependent aldehyde dehydrogenase
VKNPIIRAVGFTGSRSGGRALFDLASQRRDPIPVFAEMSSINPIFLLPELTQDEFDKIADGLFVSATMGVGQFCTNPGIVFYREGVSGNNFRNSFVEKMKKFEPATMLHRGIRNSYGQGIEKISNCEGVKVLLGTDDNIGEGGCDALPSVLETSVNHFLNDYNLSQEIFGPATLLVSYRDRDDLLKVADELEGQLTASLFGHAEALDEHEGLIDILETKAGRLLFNQFPTGVEVCESIVHGGPYPATTDSRSTSVGTGAILRFARPVCFQGFPGDFLPPELRNENPNHINRKEN